jgi:DNA-binding transcriptional regulator YiaG
MAQVKKDVFPAGPIQPAGLAAHSSTLSIANSGHPEDAASVEERIQQYVELAIERCGSAAALARELDVKPPTVSQWRTGRKKPDAVNLMRIQDLAKRGV